MKNNFQPLRTAFLGAVALAFTILFSTSNAAVLTLAGFEAYPTTSSGAQSESYYLFSDNSSQDIFGNMTLTEGATSQSSAIDLPLSLGVNEFTFSNTAYAVSDGSYAGISLFFTSTGSFNPSSATSASNPDLSAFTDYPGGSVLSTPASGTSVPDYSSSGSSATEDAYSGATSFTLDGYNVAITALTASGDGGSFALTVTPATTPEPSSTAFVVIALGALALFVRLRHRNEV